MNYPFRTAALGWLTGGDAADFRETMETIRENYPPAAFYGAMNFLGTHDTPRILTLLGARETPPTQAERAAYRPRRRSWRWDLRGCGWARCSCSPSPAPPPSTTATRPGWGLRGSAEPRYLPVGVRGCGAAGALPPSRTTAARSDVAAERVDRLSRGRGRRARHPAPERRGADAHGAERGRHTGRAGAPVGGHRGAQRPRRAGVLRPGWCAAPDAAAGQRDDLDLNLLRNKGHVSRETCPLFSVSTVSRETQKSLQFRKFSIETHLCCVILYYYDNRYRKRVSTSMAKIVAIVNQRAASARPRPA